MYVTWTITKMSYPQLGATFAHDHSTVHSNIRTVESDLTRDAIFEAAVAEVIKEVKRQN